MFSPIEKDFALKLARRSIKYFLETGSELKINEDELPSENFKKILACFVTLTIAGKLRGCIGHLESFQSLYQDVIENAISSAFNDFRFTPLQESELAGLEIEISVLSEPEPLNFSSPADLLKKLKPDVDGVIINKDGHSATYLPQVWEELPDKTEFLSTLCLKAGLSATAWQEPDLAVSIYQVEVIK